MLVNYLVEGRLVLLHAVQQQRVHLASLLQLPVVYQSCDGSNLAVEDVLDTCVSAVVSQS
jgi:hypothetical protein